MIIKALVPRPRLDVAELNAHSSNQDVSERYFFTRCLTLEQLVYPLKGARIYTRKWSLPPFFVNIGGTLDIYYVKLID